MQHKSTSPAPTGSASSPSWWRLFLKPGWVLFALFVVAFSYFAFTVLAPWQLNKDDDIVARNHQLEEAFSADPVPYNEVFSADGSLDPAREWARVTLTGEYLNNQEVLLRLRPVASGPSYQSLVPFRTTAGDVVLINRGWIEAGPSNVVPEDLPAAPTGEVTITGLARVAEAQHPNPPITEDGYKQVYSIFIPQIADIAGQPDLMNAFVQLSDAAEPGVLNPIPVPSMDRGNHLSYGYQWIAFGLMAPLGLGYFAWSEIRERRRAEEEEAEMALDATTSASAPDAHATPTSNTGATPASSDRRARSRYGDSNPDHFSKFAHRSQDRA